VSDSTGPPTYISAHDLFGAVTSLTDIVQLLFDDHTSISERFILWERLLPAVEETGLNDDIRTMMDFYDVNVREHFLKEEMVIGLVHERGSIVDDERLLLDRIMGEHVSLLRMLGDLEECADRTDLSDPGDRETFTDLSQQLIRDISEHADLEDERLFPLLRSLLTPEDLKGLEERLKEFGKDD